MIAFIYLGHTNDLPFLKTVDAITYYPEQKKVEIQPGKTKTIWKLYLTCPHCDKAIFCRELLYEDDVVQMTAAFVTACPERSKRFNVHLRAHTGIYLPPQERKMPAGVLLEYAHKIKQLIEAL